MTRIIGDDGTLGFTNTDSTDTVTGELILGNQTTGNGTYTVTGLNGETDVDFVVDGNGTDPNGALIVGNAGTGTFIEGDSTDGPDGIHPGVTVNVAGDLVLGHQIGSVGTYTLNDGSLNVGGQLAVGGQSTGNNQFIQNGGTLTLTGTASGNPDYASVDPGFGPWGGALAVGGGIGGGDGSNSGGTGTYTLNNGFIFTNNLLVGGTGTGVMTQFGGVVTTSLFTLGFGGTGTYNLDNGTIEAAGGETIGYSGTGELDQAGGTNQISGDLYVGAQYLTNSPGTGSYNLTGGEVDSGNAYIGAGEIGTFSNIDAVQNVTGNLFLGDQPLDGSSAEIGSGTYAISGDTARTNIDFAAGGNGDANPPGSNGHTYDGNGVITGDNPNANGALIVGETGSGTFTQGTDETDANNQVNVAGDLVLGHQPTAAGLYTLNSGSLSIDGKMVIGGISQGANQFIQNGGAVTLTGDASGNADYVGVGNSNGIGSLLIGGAGQDIDGGTGTYTMAGGTLSASLVEVGHSGTGTFTQSDGIATISYALWVANATDSIGTYSLSGAGVLNAQYEQVGTFGTGMFDQSGGVNTVASGLVVGVGSIGANTYTLSAGGLSAQTAVIGDGGIGIFAQGGGIATFTSGMTLGNLVGASGTANIDGGDLTVDGFLVVGELGQGSVTQTAGSVTANGLNLGNSGTSPEPSGTYDLIGNGTLHVNNDEIVGNLGSGTFDQGEDLLGTTAHTVAGNLYVGAGEIIPSDPTRQGTFNLYSGVLSATNTIVADAGLGVFNQSGGTHSIAGSLTVGAQNTPVLPLNDGTDNTVGGPSEGTYTLSGGVLVSLNATIGDAGNGTFTQTGGLVTIGQGYQHQVLADGSRAPQGPNGPGSGTIGTLTIGAQGGSTGIVNLGTTGQINASPWAGYPDQATGGVPPIFDDTTNAPYLQVFGNVVIGRDGDGVTPATGTFNLAGDGSTLRINSVVGAAGGLANGTMVIGQDGTGTFNQTDNTAVALDGDLTVGQDITGNGKYFMSGGNLYVAGSLTVGDGGTGYFELDAGTVTTGIASLGVNGSGTWVQNGGALSTGYIDLSTPVGGGSGSYTINAGTVDTAVLNVGAGSTGTAAFTQNGGTVSTGDLFVSNSNIPLPGSSSYILTGGSLQVGGNAFIGDAAGGTGGASLSESDTASVVITGGLTIANPGLAAAASYTMAGVSTLTANAGILLGPLATLNGAGTISGGQFTDHGSITASGGTLSIDNDLTGNGSLHIDSGATLDLEGAVDATLTVDFSGVATAETLEVGQALAMSASITGFGSGDIVVFSSIGYLPGYSIGSYSGGLLTIVDSSATIVASLTIAPPSSDDFGLTNFGGQLAVDVTCFASGTHILTDRGEVAVEALREGDRVMTRDGAHRPIVWIGQRRIDTASHPHPERVRPIRIRRGAFADNMPHRDLLVSPDHAIFVDGCLIPARLLVNHASIAQDRAAGGIHYYHIELDRHDVILSEGLPTESYLDTGNRAAFANAGLALILHPEFTINAGLKCWQTDACAPLTVEEAQVRPIWQRLSSRAGLNSERNVASTTDPSLCLLVNGRRIAPASVQGGRYAFAVPPAGQARLVSRSARPCDTKPWLDDGRHLGVAVERITLLRAAEEIVLSPDHPALRDGWWPAEQAGNRMWRWTDGSAGVDLPEGTDLIEVTVRAAVDYPLAEGRLAA